MAENEPLTPEKQLLKLIENPESAQVRTVSVKREGKKWFSLEALKGRFSFPKGNLFKKKALPKKSAKGATVFQRINFILIIMILLAAGLTGYSLWEGGVAMSGFSQLVLEPKESISIDVEPGFKLQNAAYYVGAVQGRNIFSAEQPESLKPVRTKAVKAEEEETTKDFSLVGIAWSKNPEAMIEDKALNRTFFVRKGQSLSGGVQVVDISKDRVILSYDGKNIELR